MEKRYPIIEIFQSFQGEGRYLGTPVTFVRFGGCNLSCPWCDTQEQLQRKYELCTAREIAERVETADVVFTGGEPTLYDLEEVCRELDKKFGNVPCLRAIETNGTGYVPDCINMVACSPKPQSGYFIHESIKMREMCSLVDYKYVASTELGIENIRIPKSGRSIIYIQPEFYEGESSVHRAEQLVRDLRKVYRDVRLGIQAHKYWEVR